MKLYGSIVGIAIASALMSSVAHSAFDELGGSGFGGGDGGFGDPDVDLTFEAMSADGGVGDVGDSDKTEDEASDDANEKATGEADPDKKSGDGDDDASEGDDASET